jgi:hypothetical protein
MSAFIGFGKNLKSGLGVVLNAGSFGVAGVDTLIVMLGNPVVTGGGGFAPTPLQKDAPPVGTAGSLGCGVSDQNAIRFKLTDYHSF